LKSNIDKEKISVEEAYLDGIFGRGWMGRLDSHGGIIDFNSRRKAWQQLPNPEINASLNYFKHNSQY
jgi:hypothetical protein